MQVGGLSAGIQQCLRRSGYSQNELADKLGLHPKVLSRKLHKSRNAYLTHLEIRRIILILADWQAITTRAEVLQLLDLEQLEPTILSTKDWQTPPLSTLTGQRHVTNHQDASPLATPLRHNLPAPQTRLIGRSWAVTRLHQLLEREDVHLITLVGSGGSGKTCLALHVAREMVDTFAQGVWLVALAGVYDARLVPMHIIQVLRLKTIPGLTPLQSLLDYLRDKQLLLLLDNFEQVEAATEILSEIMEAAPGLKILITSRTVLRLYGEHELSVPPLDFPDPGLPLKSSELSSYAAIQLFMERAQAIRPDFILTGGNAADIAQICARIDGLPLALELAAARIKVLSPALLLQQLVKARLPILTGGARNLPGRQQTLRNTIEWSYKLLTPAHQIWFDRLGVFAGSWSLEATEAMMQTLSSQKDGAASALDLLTHLIDTNLCTQAVSITKQARFTMLETLHEYAFEQLEARGGLVQVRDWHACYYLQEVEAAEPGLRGPQQREWLTRLIAERKNIQAALEWSLQRASAGERISIASFPTLIMPGTSRPHDLPASEICLRLAAAFRPYWEWQGYLEEGRNWLRTALALPLPASAEKSTRAAYAKALSEAARLLCLQNDQERARSLAEESIALWRELADPVGLGFACLHRGWAVHSQGDYELAQLAYHEGLAGLLPDTSPWLYAQLLMHLAAAAGFTSRYDEMRAYYARSLELFERVGDKSSCADLLKDQGGMLILEGCYTESIRYLLHSLKFCFELGHKQFIATGIGWLSFAVGLLKAPDPATASLYSAQLKGLSDTLMNEIGLHPWSRTTLFIQLTEEHIRSYVDQASWDRALATGYTMTITEAIALVEQLMNNEEDPR